MPGQEIEALIRRMEEYGTEAGFAKIVADALALVPAAERYGFKRELGRHCGGVPPSTVENWSRGSSVPGENVRRFVLDRLRDLLANRP